MKKIILHLCADIGSDSRYYQLDDDYEVIRVGESVGVENFSYTGEVQGIVANPPCTEFSRARTNATLGDLRKGMSLVDHCMRIIKECNPNWWVMENPATGALKDIIGKPKNVYHPWQYGDPWTKKTALWGNFKMPEKIYTDVKTVPRIPELYVRKGYPITGLYQLHKSAIEFMPMYHWCEDRIKNDADIRSLCSDGFAKAFKELNV